MVRWKRKLSGEDGCDCLLTAYPSLFLANAFLAITKYGSESGCNHNGYALFVSLNYLEKKYYYLSSQVGYITSKYEAYGYNYMVEILKDHSFITDKLHLSTTFRGRLPINKLFIYAGVGPKMDITLNKRDKVADYEYPNLNKFENGSGIKIDGGQVGIWASSGLDLTVPI